MSMTVQLAALTADHTVLAQGLQLDGTALRGVVLGFIITLVGALMGARMLAAYFAEHFGKMLGTFLAGAGVIALCSFPDQVVEISRQLWGMLFPGSAA